MLSLLLVIFMIHGQEEVVDPNVEVIPQIDDAIVLLSSHAYPCGLDDPGKHCARNLVYDKGTVELHVFLSDNRRKDFGDVDINQVLRNPASYQGKLTSFSLDSEFAIEGKKITTLNASFTKEFNIKANIIVGGKRMKKTIAVPKQ